MWAASLALLAACSSEPYVTSPLDRVIARSRAPQPVPEFAALAEAGAPARIVAVQDAPERLSAFVLQQSRDGNETWLSADGASLAMRDGFVTGTRGFGGDMMASDISAPAALVLRGGAGEARRFHAFLNGLNQQEMRAFVCDISTRGYRGIEVGDRVVHTRLVQEACAGPAAEFTNLYWIDRGSGRIVQSLQWIGPETGQLAIRDLPGG